MLDANELTTTRPLMRLSLWPLLALLASAGCATTEPPSPPAARQVPVDAKNVVDVQRAGYKVVNRDGEKLYCRRELATGSHLNYQTTSLTEQQLNDQNGDAQQELERIQQHPSHLPIGK
jgi:hypothetical protein